MSTRSEEYLKNIERHIKGVKFDRLYKQFSKVIDSNDSTVIGSIHAIYCVQDGEITTLTSDTIEGVEKLQTTIQAGQILYGDFTSIDVDTGTFQLFYTYIQ